jgi:hypothetical protein
VGRKERGGRKEREREGVDFIWYEVRILYNTPCGDLAGSSRKPRYLTSSWRKSA